MSRFLCWWRGPLPIDQLNLVAWHRLIADTRITSYIVTDRGVVIYRHWRPLGQAFVTLSVNARAATVSLMRMMEAFR